MKAVVVKALADLRRRRLQAAVIFVTVLLAVGTGTMALTLMTQTRDSYQTAFEAQKGAHLQVYYNGGVTDRQTLASTPALIGASAFGGPYPSTTVEFQAGTRKFSLDTFGRDNPGGDVEVLKITSGHWPVSNGEIVLTRSFAELNHISVGDSVKVVSVTQKPLLTVAAEVVDIDEGSADLSSQHAWVLSSAIPALTPAAPDSSFYLMDYRFATDPTSSQLAGYVDRLRADLPPGSISGSVNYILIRSVFNITNQILTSVLLAFSVFALAATAAIVANLVTGIVISSYREIGIMKAVGFAPREVVAVFVLQILAPALAACLMGIPAGVVASQPLLANSSQALGLAYEPSFSIGLDLLALVGALFIVALAATLPALRAGLMKPVAVLASATAPRGASGRWLRLLANRARLPQPIVLGVGDAFARPLRSGLTLIAILLGVATVTVAIGLPRSFQKINDSETSAGNMQVIVTRSSGFPDADVTRILNAQPETARVVALTGRNVVVPGIGDPVNTRVFRGDASHLGYLLVSGRWFSGAGEVLAEKALLHDANLKVGDTFTATVSGKAVQLHVVGEVFDVSNLGHELFMDWATLAEVSPESSPEVYYVTLTPGANLAAYMRRIAAAEPDFIDVRPNDTGLIGPVKIIDSVLVILAIVIALIAVGGVFNTLLLNTRERVRDTATLKAVGMSPREVVVMVAASAGLLALIGGLVATPLGVGLSRFLLDVVNSSAGNDTPPTGYAAFSPVELLAILLLGVAVAVVAAMVPARWAARTNVVEVLHAE
jgi:putative ABC transport system permease protein